MATTDATSTARRRADETISKAREEQLEEQIGQLQNDLKSIADTLTKLTGDKIHEARDVASTEARSLQRRAQHAIDDAQDQVGELEDQLKQTIRRKPLTSVASAVGIGFLLALLSRH